MAHHQHHDSIDACIQCARACEHCHTACLEEREVDTRKECIRLDHDCAEICWLAAAFMSRGSRFMEEICLVCAAVCEACAAECEKFQDEHCQHCAKLCGQCADKCRRMAGATV